MMMRKLSMLLLILLSAINSFSQFTINFPTTRATFQRDKSNAAEIPITGNIARIVDRIEARLLPMVANQGTATAWTTIQTNPQSGVFYGKLKGTGGWYRLEVRSIVKDAVVETIGLDRVGIGEVFMIAGQSNARGRDGFGEKRANDDRVNTIEFFNSTSLKEIPIDWRFNHVESGSQISPLGENAWCWGELGDLLTERLNVPVMFFNGAFEGSTVTNWRESAEGIVTQNPNGSGPIAKDFPYQNLRSAINQYGSILGMRAVLWHQGETDTSPFNTTETNYATNLQKLIELSRTHSGKNLSWVVSRVSRTQGGVTSNQVLNGQNRVVNLSQFNVFAGPFTDPINFRPDGLHFGNISTSQAGLTQVAQLWNASLDNNFFNNSNPFPPASIVPLQINCNTNGSLKLSLSGTYDSYRWSNNTTSKDITIFDGSFSAVVKDQTSNYFLTTTVNTNFTALESAPTISSKGATSICQGNSVDLIANTDLQKVRWSTGDTTKTITVKTGGNYSVIGFNQQSCATRSSNAVSVKVNDLPPKPFIFVNGFQNNCDGNTVTLTSNNPSLKSFWTTTSQDSTKSIVISKVGDYKITTRLRDENGCFSIPSDAVDISIKPLPATPQVEQIGLYNLGIKSNDILNGDTFEWKRDGVVLPVRTSNIKTFQPAFYSVVVNRYYPILNNLILTCSSKPSTTFSFLPDTNLPALVVYPNPSPDGLFYVESKENYDVIAKIFAQTGQSLGLYDTLPSLNLRQKMDLSYLPTGTYLLEFYNNTIGTIQTVRLRIK